MIGRITGTLAAKQPPQVLVDVSGVGYEIDVPMSTFYNLPALGEKVSLLTHLAIREDAHLLYGFGSEIERAAFRELLKVSGIGAKTALSVLSGLSLFSAIANGFATGVVGASAGCGGAMGEANPPGRLTGSKSAMSLGGCVATTGWEVGSAVLVLAP